MKEIKIIQDDDGKLSVETTGSDGSPVVTGAGSIDEAIEQVKGEFGSSETTETIEPVEETQPQMEGEPIAAKKGGSLEDNLPTIDKKKIGARSKEKADWSDYSAI